MKKPGILRPDFVIALLAVVIGVCTMFVYIYQARIMARQMESTTWPFMETSLSDRPNGLFLSVKNKGVGPAIVKSVFIIIDGERYADSRQSVDSMMFRLTQRKDVLTGYTNVNDRVMSAGEEIIFIEASDSTRANIFKASISKRSLGIEICYCSVLGDCYILKNGKTTQCDQCD